jgi:2-oxo-3-hexenedioate decarboxylase/2-keto-4-pentenoate hydratase
MANGDLVDMLHAARTGGPLVDRVPPGLGPGSLAAAYRMADLLAKRLDRRVVGWKVGATNSEAQRILGLEEPFCGRIFEGTVEESPARVAAGATGYGVEAEIALRLARDLDEGTAHNAASVASAVGTVYPAVELNRPSFRDPFGAGGLCLIADNGVNAGLVRGPAAAIAAADVDLISAATAVNGKEAGSGAAAAVLGHPLNALAWLANFRGRRGEPLRAGDIIATGSIAGTLRAKAGDVVVADFGALGRIEVTFVP